MLNRRDLLAVLLVFWLFLALLTAAAPGRAQEIQETTVRLNPSSLQVSLGESAEVAVEVVDVQELYGFELQLVFDPLVIEIVDADPARDGIQVSQGDLLDSGFIAVNRADNENGVVEFAMTQLNPSDPVSGSGRLVTFLVRGLRAGASSPLTPVHALLARRDGGEIPATLVPGSVDVTSSPGAPPVDTPASTPVPGITDSPPGGSRTAAPTLTSTPISDHTLTPSPGNSELTSTVLSFKPATPDPGWKTNGRPAVTLGRTPTPVNQASPAVRSEEPPVGAATWMTPERLALGAAFLLALGAGVLLILTLRR